MQKNLFAIILANCMICVFFSCLNPESEKMDISGVWIGGGRAVDSGLYYPISQVLNFQNNGILKTQTLDGKQYELDYFFDHSFLILNEDTIAASDILEEGVLNFGNYSIKKILVDQQNLAGKSIEALLKQYNWENKTEILQFETDRVYSLEKKTGIANVFCYQFGEMENAYFLQKKGSPLDCNGYNQFLEQILSISKEEMNVLRWEGDHFEKIRYRSQEKTNLESKKGFQVCNQFLAKNHLGNYYFSTKAKYSSGLYGIQKIVSQQYHAPNLKENGLVRIRFVINCIGETGNFEVLELDKDYREKTFNSNIPQQLLSICKKLTSWEPGMASGTSVDSYKFLTFKIKNSEVIEIFP
ncbi:MAG: hypothetical protein N4A45_06625 [Flavobacteriales bacterium]|nr:hypothetical protein [Flavobacteriales bacterium]